MYIDNKDAGIRGTTRAKIYLARGAHTVILERPGYQTATKVIQVQRHATFTFTLEKEVPLAVLMLSLASGDSAGTLVTINGAGQGALPAQIKVRAGRQLVEVSKAGHQTWRQWVDVTSGESRQLVVMLAPVTAKEGALLVSSPISGAEIDVDGEPVGPSPALVEKLAVGPHVVSIKAPDHESATQVVSVKQGETARVTLILKALKKAPSGGSLQVIAEPANAEIYLDGKPVGRAPVKVDALAEGTHFVEGKLSGHETSGQQVSVSQGKVATIKLTLMASKPADQPASTSSVLVQGAPEGAMASVDGRPPVPLPAAGFDMTPGDHVLELTADGFVTITRQFKVEAGTSLRLELRMEAAAAVEAEPAEAKLVEDEPADADPADVDPADLEPDVSVRGISSFGARLVPPKYFTTDLSAGFPYLVEGRLTTGVFSGKYLGLDAGVELKTTGAFTEIGVVSKLRFLRYDPISTAAFVAIGGGGGPGSRDTFYFNAGLLISLSFKDQSSRTNLWLPSDLWALFTLDCWMKPQFLALAGAIPRLDGR